MSHILMRNNLMANTQYPNILVTNILTLMVQVRMRMEPRMPVSEMDKSNVTLYCDLEQGNPPTLHAVRWYIQRYKIHR